MTACWCPHTSRTDSLTIDFDPPPWFFDILLPCLGEGYQFCTFKLIVSGSNTTPSDKLKDNCSTDWNRGVHLPHDDPHSTPQGTSIQPAIHQLPPPLDSNPISPALAPFLRLWLSHQSRKRISTPPPISPVQSRRSRHPLQVAIPAWRLLTRLESLQTRW